MKFININTTWLHLNVSKHALHSSLHAMKSFATSTKSIASVVSLGTCSKKQLFNLFSVMVNLRYVSNRFKAEKLRSDMDEVTGIVKDNLKRLCTSVSICLLA